MTKLCVCVCANKCKACHVKRRWMSPRALPATQNEGGCCQVPRSPRKVWWMSPNATPASAPPDPAQSQKCHACHAKRRDVTKCHACHTKRKWMSLSAARATQNDGGRHHVTKLYVTKLCVTKFVCDKVVCDRGVCDKVVCDRGVCDKVVCDRVVCECM